MRMKSTRESKWWIAALVFVVVILASTMGFSEDAAMFLDFSRDTDSFSIETENAAARIVETAEGRVLRLEGIGKGNRATVHLRPKEGVWDLWRFAFLGAEVRNAGPVTSDVTFAAQSAPLPGDPRPRQSTRRENLGPGEKILLKCGLLHETGKDEKGNPIRVFGMRTAPYGIVPGGKERYANPGHINGISFSMDTGDKRAALEILGIHGLGSALLKTKDGAPFFPFIDRYGQFIHEEWEDKIRADDDLARQRESEERDLAAWRRPADRNPWGGWKDGPALKATGHFRVEKYQGKWWLVDPDGKLFFSYGVAVVQCGDEMTAGCTTPVTDREHYFRDLPAQDDPVFGRFFYVQKTRSEIPHYSEKGVKPLCYNFEGANMRRKYGEGFEEITRALAHRRLAAWGYNSMGGWSDEKICSQRMTPYCPCFGDFRSVGPMLGDGKGKGDGFSDVFHPDYAFKVRKGIHAAVEGTEDDPWCIGYFFGNELPWRDLEKGIPRWTCQSPADQPAKRRMLELLKERHKDIAALNNAWKTDYASWDDFLNRREAPDPQAASGDFSAFVELFLGRYFGAIREAVKARAPHKLYLGCRFNTWSAAPAQAAARHCDVVSFNIYKWPGWVERFEFPGGGDAPMLIGEWHFGTLDHGMFDHGITLVLDQRQRAEQYVAYMKGVLAHPQFVGAHWFRYKNHPTTGRASEGANAHNGLLDICDTPYRQTIEAAREVGRNLYEYRAHGKWGP